MKKKFQKYILSIAVFLIALAINIYAQNPCPSYSDLLNRGWGHHGFNPHNPQSGNWDEFAATDPNPFIIKVKNYLNIFLYSPDIYKSNFLSEVGFVELIIKHRT